MPRAPKNHKLAGVAATSALLLAALLVVFDRYDTARSPVVLADPAGHLSAPLAPSAPGQYGLVDTWPLPADRPAPPDGALSIAPMPDGRVAILDAANGWISAVDSGGNIQPLFPSPDGAIQDVAVSEAAVFVSTDERVVRLEAGGEVWSVRCNCRTGGGRLHSGAGVLRVSEPRARRVLGLDELTGASRDELRWPREFGLWPSDIAGRLDDLFTGEYLDIQAQRWRPGASTPEVWTAGLIDGPHRLTHARLRDGSVRSAALFTDGSVQLYDGETNAAGESFIAHAGPGEIVEASDLAFLPDGRLVLADRTAHALRVYGLGGPAPTPATTAEPPRSDASCTVSGDKVVAPNRIELGETAIVRLSLSITCPEPATGADVLLLNDRSVSMRGRPFRNAVLAGVSFAYNIDPRLHRIGVASFSNTADIVFPLAHDQAGAVAALEALQMDGRPMGETDIDAALATAQDHFAQTRLPGRVPVVVLLSDGEYGTAPDPRPRAEAMRDAGVSIFAVGLGGAREVLTDLAGSPDRVFMAPSPEALLPAYRQILLRVSAGIAGQLTISDEMGPEMDFLAGSASPPASEGPRDLFWARALFPTTGITMTYDIVPRSVGLHRTNEIAVARYTDADGYRRSFTFPVPEILVEVPSTPRPPEPLYLPINVRQVACVDQRTRVSVALVVDASTSMLEQSATGGTKLDAAREAVTTFLSTLALPGGDWASIIAFNDQATVLAHTTSDRASLVAALDQLEVRSLTRLDLGVQQAHEELRDGTPLGVRPVMVILTDGKANPVPADVAVDLAFQAKSAGIEIYTIGLGPELDDWALEAIATDAAHFLRAPTAEDLSAVYNAVAKMVPCDNRRRPGG